jgi:hypothetical protein
LSPPAIEEKNVELLESRFMKRVFRGLATLAFASVVISATGKWVGQSIAMGEYADDPSIWEIVIGNNVLAVPGNMIRFSAARRNGPALRLDLYLRWPDMTGYDAEAADDFNNVHGRKTILFLSFEEPTMLQDMSGRFDPIYRSQIAEPGEAADGGLELYRFADSSGYLDEVLAVAKRSQGNPPFVARCLVGPATEATLAPCERDVRIGNDLSLVYRFPRELLSRWRALDAAVLAKAGEFLKTAR